MGKPDILKQFKAAARLVNEWRDTLSYAALGAYAASDFMSGGNVDMSSYVGAVGCREFLRQLNWALSSERRLVGDTSAPINRNQFVLAAGAVSLFVFSAVEFLDQNTGMGAFYLVGAIAETYFAGGPQKIAEAYDTMWDYPRTKGGGGTTQTQRLLASRASRWMPQPQPAQASCRTQMVIPQMGV